MHRNTRSRLQWIAQPVVMIQTCFSIFITFAAVGWIPLYHQNISTLKMLLYIFCDWSPSSILKIKPNTGFYPESSVTNTTLLFWTSELHCAYFLSDIVLRFITRIDVDEVMVWVGTCLWNVSRAAFRRRASYLRRPPTWDKPTSQINQWVTIVVSGHLYNQYRCMRSSAHHNSSYHHTSLNPVRFFQPAWLTSSII